MPFRLIYSSAPSDKREEVLKTIKFKNSDKLFYREIYLNGKEYKCYILFSPSRFYAFQLNALKAILISLFNKKYRKIIPSHIKYCNKLFFTDFKENLVTDKEIIKKLYLTSRIHEILYINPLASCSKTKVGLLKNMYEVHTKRVEKTIYPL